MFVPVDDVDKCKRGGFLSDLRHRPGNPLHREDHRRWWTLIPIPCGIRATSW